MPRHRVSASRRRLRPSGPAPTVEQARAFCAVADAGSYAIAAEDLGASSAVAVYRLVGRFTASLDRGALITASTTGKASLTDEGQEILDAARRFVHAADNLTLGENPFRLSAYPSIAEQLVQRCPELLAETALVEFRDVTDATRWGAGTGLIADLLTGRLDLAIAPSGLGHQPTLEEIALYHWTLRAVRGAGGGLRGDSVRPRELAKRAIAAAPEGHRSRGVLSEAFAADGLRLRVELETSSQELLRRVAQTSPRHIAILPDDAFGAPDTDLGPAIRNARGTRYGGSYSLYLRASDAAESQSLRSQRLRTIADMIATALRGDVHPPT